MRIRKPKLKRPNFRVAVMVVETGSSPTTGWVYSIHHSEMYLPACRRLPEAESRSAALIKMYEREFLAKKKVKTK